MLYLIYRTLLMRGEIYNPSCSVLCSDLKFFLRPPLAPHSDKCHHYENEPQQWDCAIAHTVPQSQRLGSIPGRSIWNFLMDKVAVRQVALLVPCLCHSIDALYSSSYIHCSYQKDELEKSWIFFGSGGILDRKVVPRHQLVHHTEMSVSIIKTNSGLGSYLAEKNFHSKCSWSFM